MQINKVNTKLILSDYTYILDRIFNEYQYKDILVNTDRFSFVERLSNDFNKHKCKKYVIGKEYIFGEPTSNYLDRYFKVVFLGCINFTEKEMKNIQKQGIMYLQGMFSYDHKLSINVNVPHSKNLIYYFATKNDYIGLTENELNLIFQY